jgi:hypothetical protein
MLREAAKAADVSRSQLMSRAIKAYNDQSRPPLKVDPKTNIDDNVLINYARTIVEKGVSFLFGNELSIEVTDPLKKKAAQTAGDVDGDDDEFGDVLEAAWPKSYRGEDFLDLATNGGQTGHAWAQIIIEGGEPSVVVLDPLNMSAVYDERNIRRVLKYTNEWNSFDDAGRAVVRRQTVTRTGDSWLIEEFVSYPGQKNFTPAGAPVPWRYSFAPVFQVKNLPNANVFYGQPDLTLNVLQLNYYLNRVDSIINKILRIHAHPKTVAYGMQPDDLKIGTDDVLFVAEFEAELKNLEMQSDLTAAQTFRDKLRAALSEVSHVPEITTGKVENLGTLSGRAMQILYGPLADQTKKKRLLYGRLITEIVVALLAIKGKLVRPQDVKIHWGEIIPGDEKEQAETLLIDKQFGVSDDTLMRKRGYDPDDERDKKQYETSTVGDALGQAFDGGKGSDLYGNGGQGGGAFQGGAMTQAGAGA